MPEWLSGAFEFLVDMNMHPAVTAVVFLTMIISRVRFEEPHIQAAKDAVAEAAKTAPEEAEKYIELRHAEDRAAERISQITLLIALGISIAGQFTLYWPKSGQARALCAFFSIAHVCLAMTAQYFTIKFGLIDRLGKRFRQKVEGTSQGPPKP